MGGIQPLRADALNAGHTKHMKKTPTLEDLLGTPGDTPPIKHSRPQIAQPAKRKVPTGLTRDGTPRKRLKPGEGKRFFPEDEQDRVKGLLSKLRAPISTRQFAAENNIATIKVRQAAYMLQDERKVTIKKVGGALMIHPK